jgi:hypothetical protein
LIHSTQASSDNEKLDDFFAYFTEQWLENPHIPHEVWNVFNQRHRTTNAVEGWNRKLNALVGIKSPNIYFLIQKLKELALESTFFIQGRGLGVPSKKRKTSYINLDRRIQQIIQTFQTDHDLWKCVKSLSYVNSFK